MKLPISLVIFAAIAVTACQKKEEQKLRPEGTLARTQEPAPSKTPEAAAPPQLPYIDPGAQILRSVNHAVAVLHPTKGHEVGGVVRFSQTDDAVKVTAHVTGLPPGQHAYHVHMFGDCSGEDGKSAGTHFNFEGSSLHPPSDIEVITGDLGEVLAGSDGSATVTTTVERASLSGPYSIIGRSVIVHEKANDPSKPPMGAAGARFACGVIGIENTLP